MARAASTYPLMARGCGRAAWTPRCDCGIYARVDSCSSLTSRHKSSHWASVPPATGSLSGRINSLSVSAGMIQSYL